MERYPFLTVEEHKILQSQQEHKPIPYRRQLKKRIPKYLKTIEKCNHDAKQIYPHYCNYHMKNVVVCDLCHAELLPPSFSGYQNYQNLISKYQKKTHLQKQKVAHDWFL